MTYISPPTAADTPSHAIVIGAGMGGLAAAMRLGAKGYRVTVIDRLDMPGGRGSSITQDGHRFDLGPTIVTVPQGLRDLWAICGRDFDADVDLRALNDFYQIRWADGSHFTARSDTDAMNAEVARLSPRDVAGYAKFLRDAEARYWFGYENLGRRSMGRLMDIVKVLPTFARLRADRSVYAHAAARVKDERLRFALSFHPLFIGGDPFHVTSMYILVSHLEKQFGVHYAMGGVAAIAGAMARVIVAQGGSLQMNTDIEQIVVQNGRAVGVRLADGRQIRADIVVSNADAGHTYDHLLSQTPRKRWTPAKTASRRWSMSLFVWYFGTKGTALKWPGVGHHTIVVGPRYREHIKDIFQRGILADDMSLYVHRPSVTDPSVAPAGDDTFYVLSPVPHLGIGTTNWETEAETYKAKMLQVLEDRLLPGLSQHIGPQLVLTPQDFQSRYRSPYGAGFSIEPRILQSAYFRPHNISEEVANLYLVGAGTHPGAGLPGVISSAEVTGNLIPPAPRPMLLPKMAAE
jgi:phytoene desaturase